MVVNLYPWRTSQLQPSQFTTPQIDIDLSRASIASELPPATGEERFQPPQQPTPPQAEAKEPELYQNPLGVKAGELWEAGYNTLKNWLNTPRLWENPIKLPGGDQFDTVAATPADVAGVIGFVGSLYVGFIQGAVALNTWMAMSRGAKAETLAEQTFAKSLPGTRLASIWGKNSEQYQKMYDIWRLQGQTAPEGKPTNFYTKIALADFIDMYEHDAKFRAGIDEVFPQFGATRTGTYTPPTTPTAIPARATPTVFPTTGVPSGVTTPVPTFAGITPATSTAGFTMGAQLNPITTPVGQGYAIIQNGQEVGEISYATNIPGVDGIIIDRVDIIESARRQGLATQAVLQVLSDAESQGVPLYTGMMEADGVQLFNALQERGIISLTPASQRMLGDVITRGVPQYAPTTAMAEGETVSGMPAKELWQMTRQEYIDQAKTLSKKTGLGKNLIPEGKSLPEVYAGMGRFHKTVVESALSEGKPVPAEVLKDYPDLAAKVPTTEAGMPEAGYQPSIAVTPTATAEEVTVPAEATLAEGIEAEATHIPPQPPVAPPPNTPMGEALGRSDNDFTGIMADLQDAQTVADIAFRNDMVRKAANNLPGLKNLYKILNPQVVANTPAEKAIIVRATLRDEGYQKTQGVMAYLNELGSQEKIFGVSDSKGFIKSGLLKGQTLGDIAQSRSKWESKLTDAQKVWLDRADTIERSVTQLLKKNDIEINELHLEEGGQFATRRVWARTLNDGTVIDVAYVGAGPGRIGSRLPTEKHRIFKTEAQAIEAGYRYIPYEEALYMKVQGAYNRVADKKMADWLLIKIPWRTTGASEELKLAAEAARVKLRHSQMLLAALNRAIRGERISDVTLVIPPREIKGKIVYFKTMATSYPNQAQAVKDLVTRIQAGKRTAKEVQDLTGVLKGLIDTNKLEYARAIAARARSRELAMTPRYGEAMIPAPAFAGKILTGSEAKETGRILRESFEPSFSKALGEVNKANAVSRYFMLAGDFSPFTIQLIFLMGENPKIYGKAFIGAVRAMVNPDFNAKFLSKHKATIDKHPNLLISKGGGTEFTEAMARGGWLSGKTSLHPEAESYWKSLGMFLPRAMGKVGGKTLTPFQRVFEAALDDVGIYLAEAYDHLCTTPEATADVDQWINEFRGLTSSSRIGISGQQRQLETALLLAPRYNRAIAGLLFDLTRGNVRGSLARKSLTKGIAALVAIAVAISIARGEDKDEIIDHLNPNSTNFFTWDVAGQKIGPGSKVRSLIKLVAQSAENPDELLEWSMDNPALRFVRGNLSPAVGSAIDLLTGRSYIGDPTRDGMLSFAKEVLAGNLLPIWVQSTLLEGGTVLGRTARGIAEFLGGRAYPEPLWEEVGQLRDKYAQQDYGAKYDTLNRAQIDKLLANHPDLQELETKAELEGAQRGTEFEKWFYNTREQVVSQRNQSLEDAATLLLNGSITKYEYDSERGYVRPYYSGGMAVLYSARDALDPEAVEDIEKWIATNQKPEDKALDAYQEYRAKLIDQSELPRDWDDIEEKCAAYLLKLPKATRDYINANLDSWINDLPENAKRVELMRLRGIEDETWWDDYRGTPETTGGGEYPWSGGTTPQGGTTVPSGGGQYPWRGYARK